MKHLLAALAFASFGLGAATAHADTFGYCGFSSANTSTLTFNGSASRQGANLDLTSNTNGQAGSAYRTTAVAWSAVTSFSTSFGFELQPNAAGGDGISFILENAGVHALGSNGGALGYGRDLGGAGLLGGIMPSVEVEFDTFQNTWDPNGNHVAIMRNGDNTNHLAAGVPAFTMANGGDLTAWIDYDAAATELKVYLSQGTTKPASPLVSATVNIGTTVGAQAFAGFTGGTGGNTNVQQVLAWQFSTLGEPCVCGGDAACGGSTPVCDPTSSLCTSSMTDAGSDASVDSGAADAGRDAEPEAGADAGMEGGAGDAAPDGGADASDAGSQDAAGEEDGGDASTADGGGGEGGSGDAGAADSGPSEDGPVTMDAAPTDGALRTGADSAGGHTDDYGSPGSIEGGGCSCDLPGGADASGAGGLLVLLLGVTVLGRRRRRE